MRSSGIVSMLQTQALMVSLTQGHDCDNDNNNSFTTTTLFNPWILGGADRSLVANQSRDYEYYDFPDSSQKDKSSLSKVGDDYSDFPDFEKPSNSGTVIADASRDDTQNSNDPVVDCNDPFTRSAGPVMIMMVLQDLKEYPTSTYWKFCRIFVTCFTNYPSVIEAVESGVYPNLTMEDCNPVVVPVEDPQSLDGSTIPTEDSETQMRSVNASIIRMKILMQRKVEDPVWKRYLEYNEYISTLMNHNFSAVVRRNYQASADFDLCVCQKVEFNPSGQIVKDDAAAAEDNSVTQTPGSQCVGGKWITLPVVHVTPNVCPGNSDIRGCCASDHLAILMYDIPDYKNLDKDFAIEVIQRFTVPGGDYFPFDERIAFQQSESWQLEMAVKQSEESGDNSESDSEPAVSPGSDDEKTE